MSVCFVLIFLYSENCSYAVAALCEHIYMKRGARLTKARDYLFCLCRKWLSFDISLRHRLLVPPLTRVSPFLRKPHHSSHPLRHKKALFSIISHPPTSTYSWTRPLQWSASSLLLPQSALEVDVTAKLPRSSRKTEPVTNKIKTVVHVQSSVLHGGSVTKGF